MSGLDAEQLDELEDYVDESLEESWDKGNGRPRELTPREALIVASGYARNNITEEIWAEIFDVDQSTISRYIAFLTPLIDKAATEFRPSTEEAGQATRGAIALVDGTLWPCWSWSGERTPARPRQPSQGNPRSPPSRPASLSRRHDPEPAIRRKPPRPHRDRGPWNRAPYRREMRAKTMPSHHPETDSGAYTEH
jgi:hypothetical protein